jgi:membrane associated rhomboid family serine protease
MIPLRDSRKSTVFPIVTVILITINIMVFFYQVSLNREPTDVLDLTRWNQNNVIFANSGRLAGEPAVRISPYQKFIFRYGIVAGELASFQDFPPYIPFSIFLTLVTSTFLHGGFLHLAGNMLFLWIFGDNIEEAMGHLKFVLFYFLSASGGAFLQSIANINSGVPMIGASGAIAGVMAAYFMLFPNSKILTIVPIFFFFTFIEIPAVIMLGLWFVFQLIRAPAGTAGGVAVLAHVGGFLVGAALTPYFKGKHIEIGLKRYFRDH